jgi:hypothetical protein
VRTEIAVKRLERPLGAPLRPLSGARGAGSAPAYGGHIREDEYEEEGVEVATDDAEEPFAGGTKREEEEEGVALAPGVRSC